MAVREKTLAARSLVENCGWGPAQGKLCEVSPVVFILRRFPARCLTGFWALTDGPCPERLKKPQAPGKGSFFKDFSRDFSIDKARLPSL
jgi:hypothetical protein